MDGMNITRWKEKMKFLLTAFKVYYVLEGPPISVMSEEEQRKHEQDETLCKGYILSTLTDRLYDMYTRMTYAKEIWNSLEEKYTAEEEGADKFITFRFFEFAMEDNVSILDQVHKFLILERTTKEMIRRGKVHEIHPRTTRKTRNHCLSLCVTSVVKRAYQTLPQESQKENQNSNKKDESANAVEQVDTTKITAMVFEINIRMIQILHMASVTRTDDWWYDSSATTHVCNYKDLFKTYKETKDGHEVMMGDNHTSKDVPKTCKEAITSRNSAFWKESIDNEIDSLVSNNTWELLNLAPSSKAIRPDIAYAICKLSRYTSNPSQDHWKAIGRVFGYLKRTKQLALFYDRFPAVLEGYSDTSWIIGSSDSKSITGWIFTLGGGVICWGLKKQTCITHFTMKAEFLALAAVASQRYQGHIIRCIMNLANPFTKGLPKDIVFRTTREMGLKPIE
nr:glucose-6-phosphate isomerase 1, chloroplastic [Tanacetum cinerariifolium]